MTHDFLNKFERFVRKHQLISTDDKLVIGVSGGIDSSVLLDLLMELRERLGLEIAVAHINHKLRAEESEEDERFVRETADHYGVECYVHAANVKAFMVEQKTSLQVAAREIRYRYFETVKVLKNYDKIATAHNANDNAETVLINLLRGTGVDGLGGIPLKRGDIVRPLLFADRREIENYARSKGLKFREDSSNTKEYYTRNFVRLSLIPLIQEKINPGVVNTLNRNATIFQELSTFVNNEVRIHYSNLAREFDGERLVLDISKLKNALLFIQENILINSLRQFVRGEIDHHKVDAIIDLLNSESGTSIEVGNEVVVYRDRHNLVFIRNPKEAPEFVAEIVPGKKYEFDEFYITSEETSRQDVHFSLSPVVEFIDAELAGEALTLRSWHPGDWFTPLGMQGRKKLSDFLVDMKIPVYQKNNVMVLTNKDGIIWVCGLRVDDRFKLTENTRRVLRIEFGYK
ncbi:MAG TPA: tRNA lysidine(34) synthetase TilS [Candidatus Kryptonia bacterium]